MNFCNLYNIEKILIHEFVIRSAFYSFHNDWCYAILLKKQRNDRNIRRECMCLEINDIICSDWSQFFPTMIATFVGFVLAILGTWIYDLIKRRDERNGLKRDIKKELLKIQKIIREIEEEDKIAENQNSRILRINPLKCYVWDAAIGSDKISLFGKISWYGDLLQVYDTINDYNEWQLLKSDKMLDKIDVYAINIHLEELKNEIIIQIDRISTKLT